MLAPTIVVGTPAKVNELFAEGRGLSGEQVRYLVIDEVDQLIARNLYEHVVRVSLHALRSMLGQRADDV